MKINKAHLVKERNIPIIASSIINAILIKIPKIIRDPNSRKIFIKIILIISTLTVNKWCNITKKENILMGEHSKNSIYLIKLRFILFITSEVFLFISLFWIHLNNSLSPRIEIGIKCPPLKIENPNPTLIPLYGSIILIYSGVLITNSHIYINKKIIKPAVKNKIICLIMGISFIDIQIIEFSSRFIINFAINDSNFPNRFFIITRVHGSHVLIGAIIIIYSINSLLKSSSSKKNHIRFEISAWYWHFVDILWIFVFSIVYWLNFFF